MSPWLLLVLLGGPLRQAAPSASQAGEGGEPASGPLWVVESGLAPRNVSSTSERNEWNPRFSPDGRYLSFERREGSAQAILIADTEAIGAPPVRVSSMKQDSGSSVEAAFLGLGASDESFNTQLSFFPDGSRFVFTGNEGTGIYRIYQGGLSAGAPFALSTESKEDGHPALSPDGRWLVYVSARGGVGKLYLRDLATGEERPVTQGDEMDLFPAWAPDGASLAYTSGDNDNHDVFVIRGVTGLAPETIQLTLWSFDDLRPIFSPDGSALAFYSSYNPEGEDKVWSIVVVPADGSGPKKGAALAERTFAVNVVKDPEVGPAWLPRGESLVYARNSKKEFHPIYVVNVATREERRIETGTRMNHDLVCSSRGVLAFRAQVASWDDIFVVPLVRMP
jgi:Tol biopolymer transport system component